MERQSGIYFEIFYISNLISDLISLNIQLYQKIIRDIRNYLETSGIEIVIS